MLEMPPDDLDAAELELEFLEPGTALHRIHLLQHDAIDYETSGLNRFDCPRQHSSLFSWIKTLTQRLAGNKPENGVCYFSTSVEGAVVQTLIDGQQEDPLPNLPENLDCRFAIDRLELTTRACAEVTISTPLQLVKLHADGLQKNAIDDSIHSCKHSISQAWTKVLMDHPSMPDGIIYKIKTNEQLMGVALFERARHKISEPTYRDSPHAEPLFASDEIWEVLDYHKVGVVDW